VSRTRLKYVAVNVASTRGVAERWAESYQHPKDGWRESPLAGGKTAKQIHSELCKLGPSPSLDDVANVIGNKSWGHITCDGCNDQVEVVAAIGDYEAKQYCKVCLQEAIAALAKTGGAA
jgi:hypothetical protein